MTPDALDALYKRAREIVGTLRVTDKSNQTLRPFIMAYHEYKLSKNGSEEVQFALYQDVLATSEAALATIEALEVTAPAAPTPPAPTPPAPAAPAPVPAVTAANDTLVWISLDLIDAHPDDPRLVLDDAVVTSIAEQIKASSAYDPMHAISVRSKEDGRYERIAGGHRCAGTRLGGLTHIWAWVKTLTDAKALVELATSNVQSPLSPLEHGLHSLTVERLVTVKTYASKCGLQATNLSRYRRGARVFLAVRVELGTDNVIRLRDRAEHLAAIEKAPPTTWVDLVQRLIATDWSLAETKKQVGAILAGAAERSHVDDEDPADDAQPEGAAQDAAPTDEQDDSEAPAVGEEQEEDDADDADETGSAQDASVATDIPNDDSNNGSDDDEEAPLPRWRGHANFRPLNASLTAIVSETNKVLHLLPNMRALRVMRILLPFLEVGGAHDNIAGEVRSTANTMLDEQVGAAAVEEAIAELPAEGESEKADDLRAKIFRHIHALRPTGEMWASRTTERIADLLDSDDDE